MLYDYLDYDGKILLHTIMSDEVTETLSFEEVLELYEELDSDAVMPLDHFVYFDDPSIISWRQLVKLLRETVLLLEKMDKAVIGLLKGANEKQIEWYVKNLAELGLEVFLFPARGFFKRKELKISTLQRFLDLLGERSHVIVHGQTLPEVGMPRSERLHFSSISWYIYARGD